MYKLTKGGYTMFTLRREPNIVSGVGADNVLLRSCC